MTAANRVGDDGARRFDLRAWRELLGFLLRYRREVILLVVQALLTAGIDASFPLVTRYVVDEVVAHGAEARLLGPMAVRLGLMAALAGCIFIFIRLAGRLATHVAHDIRVAAFARLQQMSFSFYDRRPAGWLLARMTADCDRLARILAWGLLDVAWGLALMVGIAGALLVLSWKLALVALAVVPLLVLTSLFFQRRILASARRVRRANSRLTAAITEDIAAVRTTKALVREEDSRSEFADLATDMYEASVRNALQSALYLPLILTIGSIGVALVLANGSGAVSAGALSVGTLVAFVECVLRFFDPVNEMAATFAQLQMAQAAAERVLGILHSEPEIRDAAGVVDRSAARAGRIELRDVSFAYADGAPVLHEVNLVIEPGTTVALVGPTGGGKTTLAALACRFYEPTSGEVLVDGTDYRSLALSWWRAQVAVVQQQPFLFTGTVRDSIRYGRLAASDEEVEAAALLAGAHDAILGLPQGYETQVGERGSQLSTGQAQLVSIARALLTDAALLVLDEATSSVDAETERRIQQGLGRVMTGRTCLVIAHRLSTIRSADLIIVVDGGRIVDRGRHDELLLRDGLYRDLVLEQELRTISRSPTTWATAEKVGTVPN
jgi:ATP-binding cassette subfamily B protein